MALNILGISAFYHDSAAALISDGEIVAAAQEERFSRKKHDARYPAAAIESCLQQVGMNIEDIDYVAFYDKPLLKFDRLIQTYLAMAPRGFQTFKTAIPIWLKDKLFQKRSICRELETLAPGFDWKNRLLFAEHHQSHAASAFFPSPFEEALILTMDGVGEWATTSVSIGRGNTLTTLKEIHFPHSLGLLYSAFTSYAGFKVNSGEYKLMGLAPYGEPRFAGLIRDKLINIKADGSFRLNMDYFDYCVGTSMINARFEQLFGHPARVSGQELTQFYMDIAASIQRVTEEIVLAIAENLASEYQLRNLCLAGGVALNCVANGKLISSGMFENVWIQPAAGDSGGALGAALAAYHTHLNMPRSVSAGKDAMKGAYLGPKFSQQEVETCLSAIGAHYRSVSTEEMIEFTAGKLANNAIVGWHQGRMEFGPRALGGRSILGNPQSPDTQQVMNLKIKYRESFRPFAPSVLHDSVSDWFEFEGSSPYMLIVANVDPSRRLVNNEEQSSAITGIEKLNVARSTIPAVTHVDYSARLQTVHDDTNPLYAALIRRFEHKTGCPIVVNTSFNVRGEPIVCTPEDAFRCFMGTEMDALVIGNCILVKEEQDEALKENYEQAFELD
jgi:carbamoyltransferase